MYDSKKDKKEKEDELKFNSIYDRSYFFKTEGGGMVSTKTSFVPSETIFFSDKV